MKLKVVVWLMLVTPIVGFVVWEYLPHHHPDLGPHGGTFAEWGGGEFHLEFVRDAEDGP